MKRIVFLDYVRVFACFLVMLVHASENYYGAPGSTDMAGPQSFLLTEADRLWVSVYDGFSRMAVPLFMIVSAFLLVPMREGQGAVDFYGGGRPGYCLHSCFSWLYTLRCLVYGAKSTWRHRCAIYGTCRSTFPPLPGIYGSCTR